MIGLQCQLELTALTASIPQLGDLPVIPIHVMDSDTLYSVLDWQKVGARTMIRHYLKSDLYLASTIEHCRSGIYIFVYKKSFILTLYED